MQTTVKYDEESKEYYLDLEDFKDIVDISKVVYYKIKFKKDKSVILSFYDKNKKKIKAGNV